MKPTEFNTWWSEFAAKFPAVGEWVSKLGNAKDVIADWTRELASTDLTDAREVTARMVRHEIERIGPYGEDRQDTARRVALEASRLRNDREREAARNRSWSERLSAIQSEGRKPDGEERRYACWECLDTGYVSVVDHREWRKRKILREVKVLCRCGIGTQASERKLGSGARVKQAFRYDPSRVFRWDGNETPKVREAFVEWYETIRDAPGQPLEEFAAFAPEPF